MSTETTEETTTTEETVVAKKAPAVKETVVVTDEQDIKDAAIDYKKEYNDLLLTTALRDSQSLQALDLPPDIALDYFKKYFTMSEVKGKTVITGMYEGSKLVDKDSAPISVNDAIKHIIHNNKDLSKQAAKKAPSYKGALHIASANIKDMSVAEKVAYRKQIGPTAYRSILSKQK